MSAAERFEAAATASPTAPRTLIGVLAALLAVAGFGVTAGVSGALVGAAIAAVALVLPIPYAVALGNLALLVLLPENAAVVAFAPAEAGLLVLLAATAPDDAVLPFAATFVAWCGVLAGVVWVTLVWVDALWPAALSLGAVAAVLAYGLHRYELLRLGLLEVDGA